MDSDFRIEGRGLDASALQEEVARRVEERKTSGVYSHEVESLLREPLPGEDEGRALAPLPQLDYSTTLAGSTWEVTPAYPVATEKKLLRPFIIYTKRLMRIWARIAVGPIQREQTAFNRHAATALEAVRRQALAERAQALAEERDLCELAGAMIDQDSARFIVDACSGSLEKVRRVLVLGPCPDSLLEGLRARGLDLLRVSAGSSWDEPPEGSPAGKGPVSFLSQVPEGSQEAVLLPELAFWLKPEALVGLVRRAYLVMAENAPIVVAVHSFADGGPTPGWCSPAPIGKALEMAGFRDVRVVEKAGRGFVALAGK